MPNLTKDEIRALWEENGKSTKRYAAALGINERNARKALRRAGIPPGVTPGLKAAPRPLADVIPMRAPARAAESEPEFAVGALPEDDIPIEDLVEHRIKQFEHKKARHEATKLIPVEVKVEGPIGLMVFGDPHIDDDGTDIGLVREHSDLTHQEGVFGCNIGDSQNLWVGRLAKLWAEQSTSASQAWRLVEWFVNRTRWLWIVGGNHDLWAGNGDPLRWICRQKGVAYQASAVRMELRFPNGRRVIVNARHDFAGSSQWNPAHGVMKAATMGVRDHLLLSGHKHVSGYGVLKDPETGRTSHAVQVASYKIYDRYAMERGFRDQSLSPAAFIVVDPSLPDDHPDLIKVWWDPFEGAEYLRWRRELVAAAARAA